MSLAAIEELRAETLYVSTAGGMGPHTLEALGKALQSLAHYPNAQIVAGFDADKMGDRYAGFLSELAASVGLPTERLIPPDGRKDWNDVLMRRALA